MTNRDLTAKMRWQGIPYQLRVVCIYCALSFVLGAAILARLDTTTNRYLLESTGIAPNAIGFSLWLMIPVMLFCYYIWRNLLTVLIGLSPMIAMTVFLARQILTSETAPLAHLVNAVGILVFVVVLYYFSAETDEEASINQLLKIENETLKTRIKALEAEKGG
jgi:hypothetical protein